MYIICVNIINAFKINIRFVWDKKNIYHKNEIYKKI